MASLRSRSPPPRRLPGRVRGDHVPGRSRWYRRADL